MVTPSDPDVWLQWLQHVYASCEPDTWVNVFMGDGHHVESAWAKVRNLADLRQDIERFRAAGNVWFSVTTRKDRQPGQQRGGAEDCDSCPGFWLDVDVNDGSGAHQVTNLPTSYEDAQALVERFPMAPTAVVRSGHGLQVYWLLAEPISADEALPLLRRWQLTWDGRAAEAGYHLDKVSDLPRMMRLPGTLNRKLGGAVEVTYKANWERRYQPSDLDDVLLAAAPTEPEKPRAYTAHLAGSKFDAEVTCDEVLDWKGCKLVANDGAQRHYHWPGSTNERSFTVYDEAEGQHVTCWSETASAETGIELQRPYSSFGLWTYLEHGGDFVAAHADLLKRGWQDDGGGQLGEASGPGRKPRVTPAHVWDEPTPLRSHPALPTFPDQHLGSWLGSFARGVAHATQTPIDLPAMTALASLAVAAGGKARAEIRPGWIEPVNLYTVTAMPPGARKSAVVAVFARPFLVCQREAKAQVRTEIIEKEALKRAAESALTKVMRPGKDGEMASDEAIKAAALIADAIEIPTFPRWLADDATPEALASLMAEQGGRIGVLSAEGGIFDLMAGRYSNGEANLDIYLKGHNGDTHLLDRKGREPEFIEHPALTLGLAVQPAVLRTIGQQRTFQGRGLLARFLYSLPVDLVGARNSDAAPLDAGIQLQYEERMAQLIKAMADWSDPMLLTFTADAREAVIAFLRRLEPRLGAQGDLGSSNMLKEWASKLVGASVRIAGLLHLAETMGEGHRHPIEAPTVLGVIEMAESYFIPHARAAFDLMGQDVATLDAEAILAWIVRERRHEFSKRDVHGAHRARFARADAIDAPLALLEALGWVAAKPSDRTGPGRRPSQIFSVNPYTHSTDSTQ